MIPEYSEENITKLAQFIADNMDIRDLTEYVQEDLEHKYSQDVSLFNEDWENYKDALE